MLSADAIVELHDRTTHTWHHAQSDTRPDAGFIQSTEANEEWLNLVASHHQANFKLWHVEDEARIPAATDSELANVKRRVDSLNQERNDLAEELDRTLVAWIEARGLPNSDTPLNSESPGLIIDRLSILALKIYHTREETERADAPAGHSGRNRERLRILEEQRTDLAQCLDELWQDTLDGKRRFKLYRQLKMYNDPLLNPAIYRKSSEVRSE
jgi:hypothetical protein